MKHDERLVEAVARKRLERRGFHFASDPMEYGQDAYDITCETLEDVRADLDAINASGIAWVGATPEDERS